MHSLLKYRYISIFCLVSAVLMAGLSGGDSVLAATKQAAQKEVIPLITNKFQISQETPNSLFKGLPRSVTNAIRQDIAQRTGINGSRVRILSYSRQTWSDACLGLPRSDEFCAEVLTRGWRVRVSANNQTWIYRTDERGRNVRLETGDDSNVDLPRPVADAIFADIEDRFQVDGDRLKIVSAERRSWSDGCLGLPERGEFCTQAIVPGWRVVVARNQQQWVYRTNLTGSVVKYDRQADNNIPDDGVELPKRVVDAVLQDAGSVLGVSAYQLKITKADERNWLGGCLELPEPGEPCTRNIVPGWRITVTSGARKLVYHSDRRGSEVRLNKAASDLDDSANSNLPRNLADKVLRETQRRSSLSTSRLKIVSAERRTWSDSCLGLGGPAEICAREDIPGWRIVVEGGRRWVYHTDRSGSRIILNPNSSDSDDTSTVTPTRIPKNELPPALAGNAVFRAISSGGFAGRTSEIVLLEDGRVQLKSQNSALSQQIKRISASELRQFQQLLDEERFYEYDRLEYKPNRGAADFITVSLTSASGTTRYADIIQERLPQSLQRVIAAWNKIAQSR